MKTALLLVAMAALGACTNYREPQANCFNFLPSEKGCTFTPLAGPDDV
ncbi:MAG: hypothetical protein ACU0CO_14290 [Shimia sp.]